MLKRKHKTIMKKIANYIIIYTPALNSPEFIFDYYIFNKTGELIWYRALVQTEK